MNWFKKHKVLSVMLGLIVVGIAVSASGGGGNSTKPGSNNDKSSEKAVVTAKIGQAAKDGKFEFIVKSIECGKTRVGDQYLGKDAQGQFCMLNVTVKNVGNEAQSLFADNQYLYDSADKRFSADSEAAIYSGGTQGRTWYDQINPGNSVSGAIIFDVPKDSKIVSAELHDSAFSGGVKVNLK